MLVVPIVRLDPKLPLPSYAREGDAGLDLAARDAALIQAGGGRALVATGMAIALPPGYVGLIMPRSGLALHHGVTVVNSPGVIDSGYRGELKVVLLNTDPAEDFRVERGDRIAQLVVMPVATVGWQPVAELPSSEVRGEGGFGHSGY